MLSIVIPTYNQRHRLEEMLLALSQQKGLKETSVYVVNDGSTDGTKEFLDQLNYEWLFITHQPNMGRSTARNTGINQVRSKYVLLLDDDMVVTPDFIQKHVAAQQKKAGIYIGEIFNIPNEYVSIFRRKKLQGTTLDELKKLEQEDLLVNLGRYFNQWNKKETKISWVCMVAANVSFPTKLFDQVKGFDKNFKGWGVEDHELAFRFHTVGSSFYFLKEAEAFHLDHRKKINRTHLLENILYFYKKSMFDIEVKAYVDYVTGKLSMSDLYRKVMKCEPSYVKKEKFFRPNSHLINKENKEIDHAENH